MADIRIKDLVTTASSAASDDFLAVDGFTNGTRKMSAANPSVTTLTTSGVIAPGGSVHGANGAVGNPSFAFLSDQDTGLYHIGANNLGVAANGAKVLDIATTGLGITGTATISSTTASTSTGTGALIVAGGAGFAGSVIAGGTNNGTNEYSYPFLSSATTLGGFATYSSGATANQRIWAIQHGSGVGDGVWRLRAINDALSNGSNAISITRTGDAVGTISLGTTTATVSVLGTTAGSASAGALVVTGGLSAGAASYFGGAVTAIGFNSTGTTASTFGGNLTIGSNNGNGTFSVTNSSGLLAYVQAVGASTVYIGSVTSGASTILMSGAGSTALTLSSTQAATFAGAVSVGGALKLGNAYVGTVIVPTGYVTIQDSNGNTYKIAVSA